MTNVFVYNASVHERPTGGVGGEKSIFHPIESGDGDLVFCARARTHTYVNIIHVYTY